MTSTEDADQLRSKTSGQSNAPNIPHPASRPDQTPTLTPRNQLSTPLAQVLPLGNETLMNRAGQQRDAVPSDLVAEVLAGDADRTGGGRSQDTPLQVASLLW